MGCDIHAHVELKISGNWYHYNHPSADRRYTLFARMAGVRNHDGIEPISSPRGLPQDATFTTKFDLERWGSDAHSVSWLSADEVASLDEWIEKQFGYIFSSGWQIKKYPNDYPDGLEDARLVFWFDN